MRSQDQEPAAARQAWWRGERAGVAAVLLLFALAFGLLAREFAADAAKAAQRLAEAAKENRWAAVKDYAAFGTHRFALANALVALLLAAGLPVWHRPRPPGKTITPPPGARTPGWFPAALLGCVVLAGALRLPLARGGFWHDEGLQMKRLHGQFRNEADGTASAFKPTGWTDTWFSFRKPTNHTVLGVPARLCLEAWRGLTGAGRGEFSEFVVRLPSFLTALAGVALAGALGRRWGGPAAGLLAALVLAVHPWHIHWSVDARAYGIGMFSVILGLYGLDRALASGRWRWWAVFGLAQAWLMWASLMNLWVAAGLFAAAAACVWRARRVLPAGPQWSRLFAVNVLAATVFLQVMGPNLLQFAEASKLRDPAEEQFLKLDAATGMDTLSHLLLGLPHHVPVFPGDEPIAMFTTVFAGAAWAGYALLLAAGILAVGGVLAAWRRAPVAAALLAAVWVAGVVHLGMTKWLGWYFYPRFATYLLPPVVLAWALAWAAIAGRAAAAWRPLVLACGPALLLATAWPQALNLVRFSHEPFPEIRDAFAALRAQSSGPPVLTAGYGLGADILHDIYDPQARFLASAGELEAVLATARTGGHTLYVVYGLQSFNRARSPDGFRLLDDPARFTLVRRFVSNDPRHTFFLLRATGGLPGRP